jgi:prepilin-type processing-associated H-X9-DG protein
LFILPYIEQNQRYDQFIAMRQTAGNSAPPWNTGDRGANAVFYSDTLSTYICPSDPAGLSKTYVINGYHTHNNYAHSYADYIQDNLRVSGNTNRRGLFSALEWHSMAVCTDGTSNTILFAERCTQPLGTYPAGDGLPIRGMGIQFSGTNFANNPCACWQYGTTGVYKGATIFPNEEIGTMAFDGRPFTAGFTTVLPPNSSSCIFGASTYGWAASCATSYHTGGANGGFTDGSVRFVPQTIDTGTMTSAQPTAGGQSPYGVWGALGSAGGGESKSL